MASATELLEMLRSSAISEMARYPHYAGKYDRVGLARIVSTKGLRPRGRAMWPKGKYAIGKPHDEGRLAPLADAKDEPMVALYEQGYGDCLLPLACIEWVIAPTTDPTPAATVPPTTPEGTTDMPKTLTAEQREARNAKQRERRAAKKATPEAGAAVLEITRMLEEDGYTVGKAPEPTPAPTPAPEAPAEEPISLADRKAALLGRRGTREAAPKATPTRTRPANTTYLRYRTKNRVSGADIALYDTTHPDPESSVTFPEGPRWATACLTHDEALRTTNQDKGYVAMFKPAEWCKGCKKLIAKAEREKAAATA